MNNVKRNYKNRRFDKTTAMKTFIKIKEQHP